VNILALTLTRLFGRGQDRNAFGDFSEVRPSRKLRAELAGPVWTWLATPSDSIASGGSR
jgi:hypothetical protein